MQLAPIVLFVYNRPWHTEQTLTALMQNDLADQSVLYIYADGAKENATEEELKKIYEVRQQIRKKKWCKEVYIIEAEKNKGLADSIIDGVTEIINQYGKVIVLEDDILTSDQFLPFINKALDFYENDNLVFGVAGYTYPSKWEIKNTHFLPIACSWGWATWRSRWSTIEFKSDYLYKQIIAQNNQSEFDFGNYPFLNMLKEQNKGKINSWAIIFYTAMFLQKKLFAYPEKSIVKNIGFDAAGTHTIKADNFFSKVYASKITYKFRKPELDNHTEGVRLRFQEQFAGNHRYTELRLSKTKKIISRIKKILN